MTPQAKRYLMDPDTFTTVLVAIMLDHYGTEFLEWEPEMFEIEMPNEMPDINYDKLNAATTLMTTDSFYNDPLIFNTIGEALNNDPVDGRLLDPLDPEQVAWAVVESQLLEDPEDKPRFSEDVRRYMGVVLAEYAMYSPPGVLPGIVDFPPQDHVNHGAMSDEEDSFAMFHNKQQSDKELVNEYVADNMRALVDQMNRVPLQNRDKESWDAFMQRMGQVSSKLSR